MIEFVYFILLIVFAGILYFKDKNKLKEAGIFAKKISLSLIPYVIAILLVASIIDVCVPKHVIESFMGENSGIMSLIVAALFGAIFEGPTVIAFVLGANFLMNGANEAAVATFIASFSMVGLVALPLESKELGRVFAVTRFIVTLIVSIGIGYTIGVII